MKDLNPSVSVIIPLSDDRGRGLDCIKSWTQEQTYVQHKIEVIAIANGSNSELERQAKELMRPPFEISRRARLAIEPGIRLTTASGTSARRQSGQSVRDTAPLRPVLSVRH